MDIGFDVSEVVPLALVEAVAQVEWASIFVSHVFCCHFCSLQAVVPAWKPPKSAGTQE